MLLRHRSQKADVLKNVPSLNSLSRRHLDLIARHADEVKVDVGQVLAQQGRLGLEFFLILEGSARVERDGRLIARLGPGDAFCEMSLIDQKPRSATVTADSPMAVLVVYAPSFRTLLDEIPALRKKVLVSLCERLRAADATLASRN